MRTACAVNAKNMKRIEMDEILIKTELADQFPDILSCLNEIIDEACLSLERDRVGVENQQIKEETVELPAQEEADEFCWEEYLTAVGCSPVDATLFWHVEKSLLIGNFQPGDLVAVVQNCFYWPAEIVTSCHNWLQVKAYGCTDSIWLCGENRSSVKALSVARRQSLILNPVETLDIPPLRDMDDVETWIGSKRWAPETAFEGILTQLPSDRIKVGQFVDVQSEVDPRHIWPCEILENVGGRLLLKYSCSQPSTAPFWEFYLAERVHPAGVIRKCENSISMGWKYVHPDGVDAPDDIKQLIRIVAKKSIMDSLFESREPLQTHSFELNMKMEALHPVTRTQFFPASVVEILNPYYFVIELDCHYVPLQRNMKIICHKNSPGIFPINWCAQRRLRMAVNEEFDWTSYIKRKGGKMTNECHFPKDTSVARYYRGQKLEVVNPSAVHQICVATIARVVRPLLWIHLDSLPYLTLPFAVHESSTNLFPCGWCDSVNYSIKAPVINRQLSKNNEKIMEKADYGFVYTPKRGGLWPETSYMTKYFQPRNGCQWSPEIYFNPQCYAGPYIEDKKDKKDEKLSEMPKQIGPGPLYMVLERVLSHAISSASKPRDLFMEFQPDQNQPTNPNRETIDVKAKYRAKSWRGTAEICKKMEHVQEWCRQLCILLEACPSLIALYSLDENHSCPYECKKLSENKPSSVMKSISTAFAKKLQKRIGTRNRQYMNDGETLIKRRRIYRESNLGALSRPVTRGAQLPKFDFVHNRPRRAAQRYAHLNGIESNVDSDASQTVESSSSVVLQTAPTTDDVVDATNVNGSNKDVVDDSFDDSINNIPPVLSNPLLWTPQQLNVWLVNTEVCKLAAAKLKDEHVDGQAFMLLTLEDVRKFLDLKLGPALKLCVIVKHLKKLFLEKYAVNWTI